MKHRKQRPSFASRLSLAEGLPKCVIPGCGKPTLGATGKGLAAFHCRAHVQHMARHGSHWHGSYRAEELKPYLSSATSYLRRRMQTDSTVKQSIEALTLLLAHSPYEIAARLRGLPASTRADIAFGRLRVAGIKPERLLAIYLAIGALIEEDPGAVRTREFRLVQVAKAAHRLASGYHRVWESENWQGRRSRTELHKYARSSGQVLRRMGAMIEERCEWTADRHLAGVLDFKRKRYGPHPSLPKAQHPCNKLEGY